VKCDGHRLNAPTAFPWRRHGNHAKWVKYHPQNASQRCLKGRHTAALIIRLVWGIEGVVRRSPPRAMSCPFRAVGVHLADDPGRRSAADAASLCPGLTCRAPSGQLSKHVQGTKNGITRHLSTGLIFDRLAGSSFRPAAATFSLTGKRHADNTPRLLRITSAMLSAHRSEKGETI